MGREVTAKRVYELFTPVKQRAFLEVLAQSANVTEAAAQVGTARMTAYRHRDQDEEFAAAWADAMEIACDGLEAAAVLRGRDGVEDYVVDKGEVVFVWVNAEDRVVEDADHGGVKRVPLIKRRYSDTLLLALLKAHRPEKYRDRTDVRHDIHPNWADKLRRVREADREPPEPLKE